MSVAQSTSDLRIAREAQMLPIEQIGEKIGIEDHDLEHYGRYKAKISLNLTQRLTATNPQAASRKLILVTAINPTPAGEGKTTTTIGLGDALNRLGKRATICIREPSLGPCFGMKGGAAGGGRSQVVPMEDINLHFTGDFHAIELANNLLAAAIDNHLHQGNHLNIDPRRITWRRVVDMNDRALRHVNVGLGGVGNSIPRETGFDITVASEVMAIFCLSQSLSELRQRLGDIIIGQTYDRKPIRAAELKVHGAMYCAKQVIPKMKENKWGRIINITTAAGKAAGYSSLPTAMSRAAGIAMTKSMSKEYGEYGILINTICIGSIRSAQNLRQAEAAVASGTVTNVEEYYSKRCKNVPLKRVGEAREAGDLIAFLASERASYISGTAINMDGGAAPVV